MKDLKLPRIVSVRSSSVLTRSYGVHSRQVEHDMRHHVRIKEYNKSNWKTRNERAQTSWK